MVTPTSRPCPAAAATAAGRRLLAGSGQDPALLVAALPDCQPRVFILVRAVAVCARPWHGRHPLLAQRAAAGRGRQRLPWLAHRLPRPVTTAHIRLLFLDR